MKPPLDHTVQELLNENLSDLEKYWDANVISYYGPIIDGNESTFLKVIEDLVNSKYKKDNLYLLLTTAGGSATAVERYVNILRKHFNEIHFVIPDYAYSAGTIFCMSGDSIFMDYYSVLGPIDPQVRNKEGKWVAALGYLDKVDEMIKKAQKGNLTNAEFLILKDMDLAELRGYEQAKNLTISLLKKWLVKYKFKNWDVHRSDPKKKGDNVTPKEKRKRAEEIADMLSDNKEWKSHSRPINVETLQNELRLEIEDYSSNSKLRRLIRNYYDLFSDYVVQKNFTIFLHTRNFI